MENYTENNNKKSSLAANIFYVVLGLFTILFLLTSPTLGSLHVKDFPPKDPVLKNDPTKSIYLGQGCFWHTQYDFFHIENSNEEYFNARSYKNITSLVGYAGGNYVSGADKAVCYHGAIHKDYNKLGHAEAVSIELSYPKGANIIDSQTLGQFRLLINHYFKHGYTTLPNGQRQRLDPQDVGAEYRNIIGIPDGMNNKIFYNEIIRANQEYGMKLIEGKGSNFGDIEGEFIVYIYDSKEFPFFRAENYHQFHTNDVLKRELPLSYVQDVKRIQSDIGRLEKNPGCPESSGSLMTLVNFALIIAGIVSMLRGIINIVNIVYNDWRIKEKKVTHLDDINNSSNN